MPPTTVERWEYRTDIVYADAEDPKVEDKLRSSWPKGRTIPKYTPSALGPTLDEYGAQGWELVHVEPVYLGKHHDVHMHGDLSNRWTNAYFCAFKRRMAA